MEKLGRYEIRGELGRGGMGVVYRAYDPSLDREVAIKSVRLEGVDESERAQLEERLAREAKAAAKLQHPNIVAVHDFFREGDRAYIVMEFIRGSMLDAMIVAGDRQNVVRILSVLRQCAAGLDAANALGIVHRDVKPGNILIDENGNIKITDFGIARITAAGSTQTMTAGLGSTVGTLGYMAPEQIRGEPVTGKADQFSLGVVAYQLLTGQMPFAADNWIALSYKIIHESPAPAPALNPAVTAAMWQTLQRAMSKDASARFETCGHFVTALGSATASEPPGAPRRHWLPIAAIAALALAAGVFWLLRPKEPEIRPVTPSVKLEVKAQTKAEPAPASPAPASVLDIEFVSIAPGSFPMGSDTEDIDQRPRHIVRLTKPFQMARTEVTDRQWNTVMTGKQAGTNLPKVNVSWNEAQAFVRRLNQRGDGYRYRLPTEAEWEYCARANRSEDRPKNGEDLAWYYDNSGSQLHPVATRLANPFGLHDMLGNAFEWTADWFGPEYYNNSPETDPTGPKEGKQKIYRGGGFDTKGMNLTATWRFGDEPSFKHEDVGFRVARSK